MRSLSVLVIHNCYQQPGGEDAVVCAETELLRSRGHRVIPYFRNNSEIAHYSPWQKASLLLTTTWNRQAYADICDLIRKERPDIAHCHNFLPLVSPAAYDACRKAKVPVVQTLHNYRLLCPAGTLFFRGRRCRHCSPGPTQGIGYACYRDSCVQTAAVSLMLSAHRLRQTWKSSVQAYVTPSRFCRDFFVAAGLPEQKIHVKPNFLVQDPGWRTQHGDYALFIGRLSPEKGVLELIEAWKQLPEMKLLVAGDGPLFAQAQLAAVRSGALIQLLGHQTAAQTVAHIKGARFLVFPSRWYEPFGMGLLEAAACGVPAIASRIGGIPELVHEEETGLLFDPDNFGEMAEQVRWAWGHPTQMKRMGLAARQLYLDYFTAEKNYETLIEIYRQVLSS